MRRVYMSWKDELEALRNAIQLASRSAMACAIKAKEERIRNGTLFEGEDGDCACSGCVVSVLVVDPIILDRIKFLEELEDWQG